jgi:hypothetical protein
MHFFEVLVPAGIHENCRTPLSFLMLGNSMITILQCSSCPSIVMLSSVRTRIFPSYLEMMPETTFVYRLYCSFSDMFIRVIKISGRT